MNHQDQSHLPASSGVRYRLYPRPDYVNYAYPRPESPQLFREGQPQRVRVAREDRSSIESDSSVPGMLDDHGSVTSTEEDQHYHRVAGDHIWDSFWQPSGRKESVISRKWGYPALMASTSDLGLPTGNIELSQDDTQPLPLPKKSPWSRLSRMRSFQREADEPKLSDDAFSSESDMTPRKPIQRPVRPPYIASHSIDSPPSHATPKASGFKEMFALRGSKSTRDLRSGSASSAFSASSEFSVSTTSVRTAITTPSSSPVPSPVLRPSLPVVPGPTEPLPQLDSLRPEPLRIVKQPSLPDLGRQPSRYRRPLGGRNATSPEVQSTSPVVQRSRPLPPIPFRHAHPPGLPDVLPSRQPPPRPLRTPPRAQPAQSYQAQFHQQQPPPMISVFEWDSDGESEADDETPSFAKRIGRAFTRRRPEGESKREASKQSNSNEHKREISTQSQASDFSFSRERDSALDFGLVKVTSGESWKPAEKNWDGRYEAIKHLDRERDGGKALKRQGSAFFGKILGRK